jgi:hypothetical protein
VGLVEIRHLLQQAHPFPVCHHTAWYLKVHDRIKRVNCSADFQAPPSGRNVLIYQSTTVFLEGVLSTGLSLK